MKSSLVIKRSVAIGGHRTSVSLEYAFWAELKNISHANGVTVSELVTEIDMTRGRCNLSSALRHYVFHHSMSVLQDQRGTRWT